MDSTVKTFLSELGLSAQEIKLYSVLASKGPLPILELSRLTSINRTRVYRLLEHMQSLGVIDEIVDEYRKMVQVTSVNSLDMLITRQETKALYLRKTLPAVSNTLSTMLSVQDPATKLQFYKGESGIRQMVWNTLQTDKFMLSYTCLLLHEIVGDKLAARWQEEWLKRKLMLNELYSENVKDYYESQRVPRLNAQQPPYFVTKHLPSSILSINLQMDIYNDTVAYYSWGNDINEIFGVELHNKKIADQQRQLFQLAWSKVL